MLSVNTTSHGKVLLSPSLTTLIVPEIAHHDARILIVPLYEDKLLQVLLGRVPIQSDLGFARPGCRSLAVRRRTVHVQSL